MYVCMSIYVKVHETSFILQTCAVCDLSTEPTRQFEEGAKNTAAADKGSSRDREARSLSPVGESCETALQQERH